jgi:hypothetical protein
MTDRMPSFLLQRRRWFSGWLDAARVLLQPAVPDTEEEEAVPLERPGRVRVVFTSVFFHIALVIFLVRAPWATLSALWGAPAVPAVPVAESYEVIYPLPARQAALPFQSQMRRGGAEKPQRAPQRRPASVGGAGLPLPRQSPRLSLVLKVPRADRSHQLIVQATVPPDVRIPQDLPLPNVLLAGAARPSSLRAPLGSAIVAARAASAENPAVAVSQPVIPDAAFAVQMPATDPIHLATPEVALPLPSGQPRAAGSAGAAVSGGQVTEGAGLLILGENPALPGSYLNLPFGNRFGQPALALHGSGVGLPGGRGGSHVGSGDSGTAAGAAESSGGAGGAGFGFGGDVGNADRGAAALAAFGPPGNASGEGGEGILPPWLVGQMIFPVTGPLRQPPMSLIVTAGPIGGGGLGVFGVLHGPKIYTVYLPMPGRPWVLQYCALENRSENNTPYRAQLTLPAGITPPEVLVRFDFHRPPVPAYKKDALIVLHGEIDAEGHVQQVKVFQGVLPLADQAAVEAFRQWRFRPATVDAKPVAIEILVGIPYTP